MKLRRRFFCSAAITLALLLTLLHFSPVMAEEKIPDLRFYAFDVGQGDSFFFVFPNGQTMLIDAGPESGVKNVVRFLRDAAVKKIDVVVATHPHSDHIGGMPQILRRFAVGEIWDSGFAHGSPEQIAFYNAIKKKNIPFGKPKAGYRRMFGDVCVEVIGPKIEIKGTKGDANNNSIILLVTYKDVSFLMTADMDAEQRASLSPLPKATLLKMPHHGSAKGTDMRMMRDVSPFAVVFSYAQGNSYGHPHKEVLDILRKMPKIKRFDTVGGTLKFRTDGKQLTYPGERAINTK
ncbi:MBL fold metallo-hydrolase [Synergistaceae bacterium OttesenSCG-928-D05]|nr:MBL fold metallo-hydrolase [Synergistaceae bacterium OttesenSCG-928-D05]